MVKKTFNTLIVRCGSGGISFAVRLVYGGFRRQIELPDRSEKHYYHPSWTGIGAGRAYTLSSTRSKASMNLYRGEWVKDCVNKFHLNSIHLQTDESKVKEFDALIVATGLKYNSNNMNDVEGNLGKNGLINIYPYDQLDSALYKIHKFRGGIAIITSPPVSPRCAGAPQMVIYLTDDFWQQSVVQKNSRIVIARSRSVFINIKEFAAPLSEVVRLNGIQAAKRKLVALRALKSVALFESTKANPSQLALKPIKLHYDLLHVASPMSVHGFAQGSLLASKLEGKRYCQYLDQHSVQQQEQPIFFGIENVTGTSNSKTGPKICKQAPIVPGISVRLLDHEKMDWTFERYSTCRPVTGISKIRLAQFGYEGKLRPSLPLDQTTEKRNNGIPKKDLLPSICWHGLLKGCI